MLRLLLLIMLFIGPSCDEQGIETSITNDDSPTLVAQSASLRVSEVDYSATVAVVEYTSGESAAWSAEIESESQFASFDYAAHSATTSGWVDSTSPINILYIYLATNDDSASRRATISFSFDGGDSFELELVQLSAESSVSPYTASGNPMWAEVPAKHSDESRDYIYIYHTTSSESGEEIRNFSLCYDPANHAAAWVAYPLHDIYDGSVGRNESWVYDPLLPESIQPKLKSSYTSSSYDRGHQMASDDRQATVDMNKQTFYFSNMTPQLGTLNQRIWATLESRVRDQSCSDTLYVVTGADFTTSIGSTSDNNGMECPIPGAYFKVLLRTRSGVTGRSVGECSADELKAVGFWYEHRSYSSLATPVSVAQIESYTGFTLFPTIPAEVKSSYDPTLWNL